MHRAHHTVTIDSSPTLHGIQRPLFFPPSRPIRARFSLCCRKPFPPAVAISSSLACGAQIVSLPSGPLQARKAVPQTSCSFFMFFSLFLCFRFLTLSFADRSAVLAADLRFLTVLRMWRRETITAGRFFFYAWQGWLEDCGDFSLAGTIPRHIYPLALEADREVTMRLL